MSQTRNSFFFAVNMLPTYNSPPGTLPYCGNFQIIFFFSMQTPHSAYCTLAPSLRWSVEIIFHASHAPQRHTGGATTIVSAR